ncbi:LysM peptidoglycan-binding domain-containing protein [Roseimicrobium sp. ORNL1]|uniref:LysM peptidoglycan-binding domain-containing protein n=1 Tax=Roseimicrobium sp. ORNL1 TaxID=2711231 RepID=UPI0013E1AC87|nr:LysM peptidoglycan-binding domain-containing protein [Roseimicrobium sp. ORNL1]QIF04823.1 LysM peptidoglycan-binding domain-containing protein [Roseimicrobium sp. ORNL1]
MNVRPCLSLLTAALLTLSGTSCTTWKKHFGNESDGGYSSASADGSGYNPYPGSSGTPQYQTYNSTPAQQQQPQYQTYTPSPQQQQNYAPQPDYTPSPDYSEPASSTPAPKKSATTTKKKSSGGGGGGSGGSYTVKQGDTLYRIALNKKTTVSKLKSKNGLTSDVIHPGQVLKVP